MRYLIALLLIPLLWTSVHAQEIPERFVDQNPPAVHGVDPLADYFVCAVTEPEFDLPDTYDGDGFWLKEEHFEQDLPNACAPGITAGITRGDKILVLGNTDEHDWVIPQRFQKLIQGNPLAEISLNYRFEGELGFLGRGYVVSGAIVDALKVHPNNIEVGVRPGDYFDTTEEERAVYVYAVPSTWSNRRMLSELTGRVDAIEDQINNLYTGLSEEEIDRIADEIIDRMPDNDIDEEYLARYLEDRLSSEAHILIGTGWRFSSVFGSGPTVQLGVDFPRWGLMTYIEAYTEWESHDRDLYYRPHRNTPVTHWGSWYSPNLMFRLYRELVNSEQVGVSLFGEVGPGLMLGDYDDPAGRSIGWYDNGFYGLIRAGVQIRIWQLDFNGYVGEELYHFPWSNVDPDMANGEFKVSGQAGLGLTVHLGDR